MTTMDRLRTLARDRGMTVLPDGSGLFKATVGRDAIETRDPGIEKTMHEFKRGALHSGSKTGKKVTSRKQAIAIGLSKQRRGDEVRHDPHTGKFTGAHQHTAAAEHHEEMAGHHEVEHHEARARGNTPSAVAHGKAMRAHEQAIKAHKAGARSFGAPGYLQRVAPHASEASRHAAHMSRKAGDSKIGLSQQRRGDAFTYQKAKRPTMLKSPSSPSADAATQWDRIRRRALDRGLVLDAGTSEGAKKAAATRKAHGGGASRAPTPKRFPANPQNLSRAGHRSMQGYHEQRAAYYRSKGEHEHAAEHEEVARRHARSAGSK